MLEAKVNGRLVRAGANSPDKALCPACGGAVSKRKRSNLDGGTTYFYRHDRGVGNNCPLRYSPTGSRIVPAAARRSPA
jgi:hypothetical protein